MTQTSRPWVKAGLPPGTYEALADGLSASRLWSLLLDVAEARAVRRRPAELVEQWERDRFVQPGNVDQRTLIEIDGHLLSAASAFESIELSPVAPLGACALMGHAIDWVAKLTSNRRAVYVASGLGSQLVPLMFRRPRGPSPR
jgi:hypothetical protein